MQYKWDSAEYLWKSLGDESKYPAYLKYPLLLITLVILAIYPYLIQMSSFRK
jgi:hypothetical protein